MNEKIEDRFAKEALEEAVKTVTKEIQKSFEDIIRHPANRGLMLWKDIVIMRQFLETPTPFSEEDLKEIASGAIGQVFSVDWLYEKYGHPTFALMVGNDVEFVVKSVRIEDYIINNRTEKAVYADGHLRRAGREWNPTHSTKVYLNGVIQT